MATGQALSLMIPRQIVAEVTTELILGNSLEELLKIKTKQNKFVIVTDPPVGQHQAG